ncbi:MAG: hypothetical protein KDC98_22630 [Planctomycetes bacterium]|nr:hypothetical protein [Planctomycetota bacterium]
MNNDQRNWIQGLGVQIAAAATFAEREQKREAILNRLGRDIDQVAGKIFENINLQTSDGESRQRLLNYYLRDQTTEFDLDEQQDGFTLISDEDQAKLDEAMRLQTRLIEQLDAKDSTGAPLFTADDLRDEFYTPMKRMGLLPETLIPDEFSETEQMRKGTFDAYAARVQQDQKGMLGRLYSENGGMVMSMLSAGANAVGGAMVIGQAFTLDPAKIDPNSLKPNVDRFTTFGDSGNELGSAETIAGVVGQGLGLLSLGADIVEDVSGAGGDADDNPRRKVAGGVAQNMIAAVAGSLGVGLREFGFGIAISSAYSSSVNAGAIKAALGADPFDAGQVTAIVAALSAACGRAFAKADPGNLPQNAQLADVGRSVGQQLEQRVGDDVLLQKILAADYAPVIAELTRAGQAAVDGAMARHRALLEGSKDEILAAANRKLVEEFENDADEFRKAAERDREELAQAADARSQATWLEKKIKSMERDAALLKYAESIMGLGVSIASAFIAPLAIAGAAIDLSKNLLRAANRTSDWLKFIKARRDMFNDASAFSAPVHQFVHNSNQQADHYRIQAACDLAKLIGAIVETVGTASGPGAAIGVAAGKAMQGTAAILASAETVLYEIAKRKDLETAWQTYRDALLRPNNRKLALIAMRKNPTLAKYAIAWGAVIRHDSLVVDFVRSTGIDDPATLQGNANIDQVVKFLELRMPDDNVVTGRKPPVTNWEPAKIELTTTCWLHAKHAGEQKASLLPQDSRPVEAALAAYMRLMPEIDGHIAAQGNPPQGQLQLPSAAQKDRYTAAMASLRGAFARYRPRQQSGSGSVEHAQMAAVVDRFVEAVQEREQEIEALRSA